MSILQGTAVARGTTSVTMLVTMFLGSKDSESQATSMMPQSSTYSRCPAGIIRGKPTGAGSARVLLEALGHALSVQRWAVLR